MPEATHLPISSRDLRAATLRAVRYLHYDKRWSMARIGRAIGYQDGQMVGKVLRGDCFLLGTLETANLSRLASAHGLEVMSDGASSSGKHTVPAPEALPGGCKIDGDPTAELLLVQESAGLFGASRRTGDELALDRQSRRLLGAGWALFHDARLQAGGDTMPARPHLSL